MNKVKRQAYADMLEHAIDSHRAGSLVPAELLYLSVLAEYPKNAQALHQLGVLAWQTGRLEHADRWIRRSLALSPQQAQAHHDLGQVLIDSGRWEEALASFDQALKIDAGHAEARSRRSDVLRLLKQTE